MGADSTLKCNRKCCLGVEEDLIRCPISRGKITVGYGEGVMLCVVAISLRLSQST